jgi:uncharacterized protein with HEPN domain
MIAFRNILIHGYADVDHRIVWEVATVKVPALAAGVRGVGHQRSRCPQA